MEYMFVFCIFVHLTGVSLTTADQDQRGSCIKGQFTLECTGNIPDSLPQDVTDVRVYGYDKRFIDASFFQDKSWSKVVTFHFHVDQHTDLDDISNSTFSSLSELKTLKLDIPKLRRVELNAFGGLDNLKVLDLSGCIFLNLASIVTALSTDNTTPSIDTLLLDEVETEHKTTVTRLDDAFFGMILKKNITKLSLAKMRFYIKFDKEEIPDIVPIEHLNISHIDSFITTNINRDISTFRRIKVLDISAYEYRDIPKRQTGQIIYGKCNPENLVHSTLMGIEQLFGNDLHVDGLNAFTNFTSLDVTQCDVQLRVLELRNSGLEKINITIFSPHRKAAVLRVDLSANNMNFFNVKGYVPLFQLDLSYNKLHLMETMPEFTDAFNAFPLLEELDLSHNGLHSLPGGLFSENTRLKSLLLRGNHLTTISVEIGHLTYLETIDLRDNGITHVDKTSLSSIQYLWATRTEQNKTFHTDIDFHQNPLKCSCENFEFFKLILSERQQLNSILYNLTCVSDAEQLIHIDEMVLKHIDWLCKRTLVIALSLSSLILLVLTACLSVIIRKRVVRKRNKAWLIKQFKKRKTKEKYLAFVSYSKTDRTIVFEHIRQRLESSLRKLVPVDFDLLCFGDVHFRPGVRLVDEIHRAVSESFVAIFVVSRAFCESGFCQFELKEAYSQNRPVILVFLEKVDEKAMSPLIHAIFSRVSRAWITMDDGVAFVTPSWDTLAQSIVSLAAVEGTRPACCLCWSTDESRFSTSVQTPLLQS